MPKLTDANLELMNVQGNNYQYSAVKLENLGATEYTLVTIVLDVSTSVAAYKDALEKCVREVVLSCRRSPRKDNLMIRLLTFNEKGEEQHGYKLLMECDPDDYIGLLNVGGWTALYDASRDAIIATGDYAAFLIKKDYDINGIVFIITDGDDKCSTYGASDVKQALQDVQRTENLHSITSILIGVNLHPSVAKFLSDYNIEAGFTKYVSIKDANEKTLAKIAEFVSQSISSSSTSLDKKQPVVLPSLNI